MSGSERKEAQDLLHKLGVPQPERKWLPEPKQLPLPLPLPPKKQGEV